jgi:hypothetical protein
MMEDLYEKITTIARQKIRDKKIGRRRPSSVRAKISRAMKGKSNFEGKTHTHTTKRRMSRSRGHDDQGKVGGTKWFEPTAYTSAKPDKRKKAAQAPQGYEKGRSHG